MANNMGVSWINSADQALRSAMNVADTENEKADLETAANSLPELLEAFRRMGSAASVVRPLGWEGRSVAPQVRDALRQAAETLEKRKVSTALNGLERFRGEVKTDLLSFWQRHAAERLGNVAELQVLASTLRQVDGLARLSQRLESVLGDLARTQDQLPSQRSSELLDQVESALRELEVSLQPETVRRFLSSVARGGASLELLTDDVITWLREHNAMQGLKIVAGSAPESTNE